MKQKSSPSRSYKSCANVLIRKDDKHSKQYGSVAFEYVIVTIFGVGLSLLIMSTAKKMITEKLEAFQDSIENNLVLPTEGAESNESW